MNKKLTEANQTNASKSGVMIMFARKHIFSFVEFSNSQPTLNFMHRSKDLFGFQADIFPVIPFQSLHSSGKYYELGGRGRGQVIIRERNAQKRGRSLFQT